MSAQNDSHMPIESFGKQKATSNYQHKLQLALRDDFKHKNGKSEKDEKNKDEDTDDSDDSDDELDELPISHELFLPVSTLPVTSMVFEKSGNRCIVATGRNTQYYDFPNVDKPFRELESDAKVTQLSQDPANNILVVCETKKVQIASRNGELLAESVEGDMYLVTPQNTKGHTATLVTGVSMGSGEFATSARDHTVRLWKYTSGGALKQTQVVVTKPKGVKTVAGDDVGVVYHLAVLGDVLVAATRDSLTTFGKSNNFSRPISTAANLSVSSLSTNDRDLLLAVSGQSIKLLSRDLKLQLETTLDDQVSAAAFSPDGKYIVTVGESLRILDASDLAEVYKSRLRSPGTCVTWQSALNQIFIGLTDGQIQVLFSPELSTKGALGVLERGHKKRHIDDVLQTVEVSSASLQTVNPFGEDFYKDAQQRKKKTISHHPDNKLDVWGTPDEKHVDATTDKTYRQDPREELLKYAEKAKNSEILQKKT